jgi:protein TonB
MRTAQTRLDSVDGAWALGHVKDDRSVMAWALAAAVGVHLLFLVVNLPNASNPPEPPEKRPPLDMMNQIPLPPPPLERRVVQNRLPQEPIRFVPVPEADPPEPVAEQTPVVDVEVPTFDVPLLIDDVTEPPRPPGPFRIFESGVTSPSIIAESKVEPDYPEIARRSRVESRVILEAVIRSDGTVAEVTVLQCTRPGLGFEEEAIEAIRQWRYEPGRQNGVPVDVYFTVVVEFVLQ